jgi:hypothetical protein
MNAGGVTALQSFSPRPLYRICRDYRPPEPPPPLFAPGCCAIGGLVGGTGVSGLLGRESLAVLLDGMFVVVCAIAGNAASGRPANAANIMGLRDFTSPPILFRMTG